MADVLADVTGHAGDTAPEEGSEAQASISKILTGLADKLGDEDGPSFLRMYARACEREDANPLVLDASSIVSCVVECLCDDHDYGNDPDGKYLDYCRGTEEGGPLHDCETSRVTCGNCDSSWCEKCDPGPSALCHTCHGRGHSTAPLD